MILRDALFVSRHSLQAALVCAYFLLPSLGASAVAQDGVDASCCSDLEERIEALEEAAVRRGTNDTVSLEISGHVHRALLGWSDGIEADLYSTDPTNWGTYVELSGSAEVRDGVDVGFRMSIEMPMGESISLSQTSKALTSDPVVGHVLLFVDTTSWGKLSWGRLHEAHNYITEADLSGTGLFSGPGITDWNGSFALPIEAGTLAGVELSWLDITAASIGDGDNAQGVRYETPGDEGPKLALSWSEDQVAAAAVTASHTDETFEVEVGAAVASYGSDARTPCFGTGPVGDCVVAGGSIAVLHVPSGLGGSVAAGGVISEPAAEGRFGGDRDAWIYAKVFEKLEVVSLGATVIYGEYFAGRHAAVFEIEDDNGDVTDVGFSADVAVIGGGIMQSFDAAEMQAYVGYRHYDASAQLDTEVGEHVDIPAFDALLAGMRISF